MVPHLVRSLVLQWYHLALFWYRSTVAFRTALHYQCSLIAFPHYSSSRTTIDPLSHHDRPTLAPLSSHPVAPLTHSHDSFRTFFFLHLSMFVLPLAEDYTGLDLAGAIMVPISSVKPSKFYLSQFPAHIDVVVACEATTTVDQIIELLNIGIKQVVVENDQFTAAMDAGLPAYRFAVRAANDEAITAASASDCSIVVTTALDVAESSAVMDQNRTIYLDATARNIDQNQAVQYRRQGYVPIIDGSVLATTNSRGKINIAELFTATLTTDRPDGLFTTLVTANGSNNTALGVVYSSIASIHESFATGTGVYQSRKRTTELWYKGATSGASQRLVAVGQDCDHDVVQFVVEQRDGTGFCHNDKNYTCFSDGQLYNDSPGRGLARLSATLASRKATAPAGSYTKRLFDDEKLLVAKMKEELDELIDAGRADGTEEQRRDEVAWEAADLFYFAMVWCQKYGVSLEDVERNLDIKGGKVTRRKGDAKPAYLSDAKEAPAAKESPAAKEASAAKEAPSAKKHQLQKKHLPQNLLQQKLHTNLPPLTPPPRPILSPKLSPDPYKKLQIS